MRMLLPCAFCRVLPPLTVLRVWDWLLLEGADVLIFVALAVLRFAEDAVLQVYTILHYCTALYKYATIVVQQLLACSNSTYSQCCKNACCSGHKLAQQDQ
jgi:Rab-GTPase-TBC domain